MRRAVALVILICLVTALLCGCKSDEQKIEDRLNQFLFAFNTGDMEAVLDCYDAKTRNANKAILGLGNNLLGDSLLGMSFQGLFALSVGLMSEGELLRVEDVVVEIHSSGTRATVSATLYYEDYSESHNSQIQLTMIKENGDWYITP